MTETLFLTVDDGPRAKECYEAFLKRRAQDTFAEWRRRMAAARYLDEQERRGRDAGAVAVR